jgi:hypothetical protein
MRNPFEELDINPHDGPRGITERLRELVEDAKDDAERARLRALWEELTMHAGRRVRLALLAHPESRAPLGSPPPHACATSTMVIDAQTVTLVDLALRPRVAAALGSDVDAFDPEKDADDEDADAKDPVLSME